MKTVPMKCAVLGWDSKPLLFDGRVLTVKDLCLQYMGTFESDNGRDIIQARKVGQKLFDCEEDTIALEESEFTLLERSMQKPRHIAIVMGFLLEVMEAVKTGNIDLYVRKMAEFDIGRVVSPSLQ